MAKKTVAFTRTTISVPSDLKKRMDKVAEDVNWSALACVAFHTKLAELAATKEKKTMTDVISRLRESKRRGEDEDTRSGREYGEEWVKRHAEVPVIERLERHYQSFSGREQSQLFQNGNGAWSAAERLVFAIDPDSDGDRGQAAEFWELNRVDDRQLTPAFLEGFVLGAMEYWDSVKDQL